MITLLVVLYRSVKTYESGMQTWSTFFVRVYVVDSMSAHSESECDALEIDQDR